MNEKQEKPEVVESITLDRLNDLLPHYSGGHQTVAHWVAPKDPGDFRICFIDQGPCGEAYNETPPWDPANPEDNMP